MKQEFGISKQVADMSDDEFDMWMASLPPAPGIRRIDEDDGEADATALDDLAAGRCHDHEVVAKWLRTAGETGWKPFREWLADRNG